MGLAHKILLNASLLALGRFVNAGLSVFAIGLTTRYLGVDDYGTLITAIAFVTIFGSLTDLGLWTIGSREIAKRPDEEERLVGVLFATGLVLSLATMLAAYVAMLFVYGDALQREAITLLLLQLPLAAPAAAAGAYFVARQQAYVGMAASTLGAVVMVGGILLATQLDLGFAAVAGAYLANGVVFGLAMVVLSIGRVRLWPVFDLALAGQLLRWALPLGAGILTTSLYAKLDLLILSWLSSKPEVAFYGLAFKVVETLVVLPTYVTITLLPEFSRLTENRDRLDEIMQKAFTVMAVAVVPLVVLILSMAPEISFVLGGPGFSGAATVLRILILGVAIIFFVSVLSQALVALNRQGALLRIALIGLLVNAVLNVLLISPLGADGAALAFLVTELVSLGLMVRLYRQEASAPRIYRPLALAFAGGAMAAVVPPVRLALGDAPTLVLALAGSLGVAVYVAALYGSHAMPEEIDRTVLRPVWNRLRRPKAA